MAPPLFIVCQVIDIGLISSLPVTIDEPSQDHRVSLLDVNAPFMQPSSPVRGTADRGSDLSSVMGSLIDGDFMARPSKRDGCGQSSDSSTTT